MAFPQAKILDLEQTKYRVLEISEWGSKCTGCDKSSLGGIKVCQVGTNAHIKMCMIQHLTYHR